VERERRLVAVVPHHDEPTRALLVTDLDGLGGERRVRRHWHAWSPPTLSALTRHSGPSFTSSYATGSALPLVGLKVPASMARSFFTLRDQNVESALSLRPAWRSTSRLNSSGESCPWQEEEKRRYAAPRSCCLISRSCVRAACTGAWLM